MAPNEFLKAYRQAGRQAVIPPVKLIHMLFERGIVHLDEAEKGVLANDPRQRGENVSKVIAIVTELNAAIDRKKGGESAEFLASLYEAILFELPRVAVSNDVEVVRQARRYLRRLKEIWEETAMRENIAGDTPVEGDVSSPAIAGGRGDGNKRVANLSLSI